MGQADCHDETIKQGETYRLFMTWTSAGIAVNLTGFRIRLQVRPRVESTTTLIDFDSAALATGQTIGALNSTGVIDLKLSAAITGALNFARAPYDLIAISGGGEVYRLLSGTMIFSEGVTR